MIRSLLFLLLISCFSATAQHTGSVKGKVTDAQQQKLSRVTVHLLNTNFGAVSDEQGDFAIAGVPNGKYVLQVTAIGFANRNTFLEVTGGGEAIIDVTLQESATQLDDVVVTAQKQEEDPQKVPFTVNTISSRQVEEYRLWNSRDITAIVPNLYSTNPGDNRNVTSIRGVTTTSYDPAVATYVDGVNQFGLDTYIAQLFDVERIEVLSGPQGTLYGRNAMGGVINIITKQPTNITSGFGEVSIGNFGQKRFAAGVRTPLVKDKLYFGTTWVYDANNGFYKNDFNDDDFDKKYSLIGNHFLKFYANPRWAFTLNVKHSMNRNNGAFPLAGNAETAFEEPYRVNQNATTKLIDDVFNSSLVINHAGDIVNFSSQTAYQSNYRYYKNPIDGDFSPADFVTIINNYGKDWNNVKAFTQEFKFSSPASSSSPFKWTAGTYFFRQDNPVKQAYHYGEDAGQDFSQITTTEGESTGIAVFGQGTMSLTDRLDVILGLRYDYEHKTQTLLGEGQQGNDPVFELAPEVEAKGTFKALSPKGTLAYRLTDLNSVYATYSRGFRAGGINQIYTFKPEYGNNLEVGFKNVFFDNRVQLNVAAFFISINDAQVPKLKLPEAITITENAGKLTSTGVDIHVSATPVHNLQLEYNLGVNDAKYKKLLLPVDDGEGNTVEVDMTGNKQIFTPNVTSMFAAQYGYSVGPVKIIGRGEWMLLGKQYFDLANSIEQESYSVLNARLGVAFNKFEIMFWGRNLADEKYIAYAYDFGGTNLGNPRNYGVTVRANF